MEMNDHMNNIEMLKIADLIFDPANLRKHGKKNIDAIKASIVRFKQQTPIVIDKKNIVRKGNGTLAAAIELGWTDIKVVRTDLEGTEATAYAIADNRTSELAEWDNDALKDTLQSLADDGFDLSDIGFDDNDLGNIFEDKNENNEDIDNNYSRKIESPIYEPKLEFPPKIEELYDEEKTNSLIRHIEKSSIKNEEKKFLIEAAKRHTVFNYRNIAEYYSHGTKEIKDLMEQSALVIIDYDKAIENGFVVLSKDMAEAFGNDE